MKLDFQAFAYNFKSLARMQELIPVLSALGICVVM